MSFTAPEQPQTRTASVNDSGQQKSNQPLAERKVSSSVIPEGDLSTKPNVTDADDPQEPEVFEDSQSSAVSQKKVNPFQKELQKMWLRALTDVSPAAHLTVGTVRRSSRLLNKSKFM